MEPGVVDVWHFSFNSQTNAHADDAKGWYIPSSWLAMAAAAGGPSSLISSTKPQTVLEAAQLVLELSIRNRKFARNSKIPLVAHQTWKSLTPETWSPMIQESVEGWLNASTGVSTPGTPEMAYILWDDEGIESLIKQYEPKLWEGFKTLPYPVEKADTFRVAVVRWFGGYVSILSCRIVLLKLTGLAIQYADVDVNLIQHPSQFVQNDDLTEWRDPVTDHTFGLQTSKSKRYQPPDTAPEPYQQVLALFKNPTLDVGAIYGIEADTPPNKDDYWRMGYSYPVQITNWALAAAPQHPTTARYLEDLDEAVKLNSSRLHDVDPLDLTGPPALTKSVKGYCEELNPEFRWYGLSGREDPPGGRGKIIASDTLILPITGFS